jgi:hypothetical protein
VAVKALVACPGHVHDHERGDRQYDAGEEKFFQHATHTLLTADGIRVLPPPVRSRPFLVPA